MGLALDELKDDDKSFDDRGLTFVMEEEFYEKIKPVKVDYVDTPMGAGFNISSNMTKPESSCGSSCSSCYGGYVTISANFFVRVNEDGAEEHRYLQKTSV